MLRTNVPQIAVFKSTINDMQVMRERANAFAITVGIDKELGDVTNIEVILDNENVLFVVHFNVLKEYPLK